MSRLGMLYAITSDELEKLEEQPEQDKYAYMLEKIEDTRYGTPKACELNKAWFGLHYAFNNGKWVEDNSVTAKIIFSGKFLLDNKNHVITLKKAADIKEIVDYLTSCDSLEDVIKTGFKSTKAEDLDLPKDDNLLSFLLGWSEDLLLFYKYALHENLDVIFTVDL